MKRLKEYLELLKIEYQEITESINNQIEKYGEIDWEDSARRNILRTEINAILAAIQEGE
jgi:hypothetical protein